MFLLWFSKLGVYQRAQAELNQRLTVDGYEPNELFFKIIEKKLKSIFRLICKYEE